MKPIIYADNAATTKLSAEAFEAMKPYFINEYGNPSQPYSFSRGAKKAIREAREIIACCINSSPEEIYFTSGGTEADNWAIKGSAFSDLNKRVMITSSIEHHAVLNACASIERLGYPVAYLNPDSDGVISESNLSSIISRNTRLVSIMTANNEIGTIEPISKLAEISHKNGAIFHTDAVQAIGHIKVDVKDLGVDLLSASAHKFNGPKGIGFLYIKNGTPIVPLLDGGAQEHNLRAGTENVASIVGMAIALQNNCKAIDSNIIYLKGLEKLLLSILTEANFDFIYNGSNNRIPGNINISLKDANGEALLHRLDLMGIAISTGAACDSKDTKISHVIKAIGVPNDYAEGTIRISLSKDNTEEDIIKIVDGLKSILK